LISVRQ